MTSPPFVRATAVPTHAPSLRELEEEVASYREARLQRLTSGTGWLSIIAKVWLREGSHSVGSHPDSAVRLPGASAPAVVGWISLDRGVVTFDAHPSAAVFADGEPVRSLVLRSDADESPQRLTTGTLSLEVIRRGADFALRVRDAASPRLVGLSAIPAYPVDPGWRFVARLQRFAQLKEVVYADNEGRPQTYRAPGVLQFEKNGKLWELTPVIDGDRRRLFVSFADATNGDETYGAGRFLYAALPGADAGDLVLDFNKAFNPPCAFTELAACPLPPPENRLSLRVTAGEKRPVAA